MYNNLYELIISDIMMPEIDGFEFAQTVRQVNRTIPILFMSAKDDLPSKQRGFQLGIDDYMVKPIELDELLLRVRALLRRANIEMERKIIVGNLVLDADGLRAVDVYVTKLRDKLSACDGFQIVTVRGLGYKAVLK